jgi:hypothetical protein
MQCAPDQLVRDMRTVKIASVDMVDPAGYGLAQHRDGAVNVAGRPPDEFVAIASCELHGTVTHAPDGERSTGKRKLTAKIGSTHLLLFLFLANQIVLMRTSVNI